ncbi:head-tail connector protein [Lactiplantibacillus pentosus]
MATTVEPKPITPTLQNCSITEPAKSTDGKYYLDPDHMTVTLKADTGYTFETDGTLTYLSEYSSNIPVTITATKNDTATVTLPSTISWADQFDFPLTMSAVKAQTQTTTPTTEPTGSTGSTTPTTQPTTSTTPTTQLDVLKTSLRIPLDLKDDDSLLQSYLDGATEYLKSTLDEENMTRLDGKRARVVINALAELLYQNRGDDTVTKDLPFTLRALINQLKY